MTEESKQAVSGWFATLKDWIVVLGGTIAIGAAIWAMVAWLTGGLKPQTQIDQDALKTQLSQIEDAQRQQFASTQAAQDRIMARLDAMPRPTDYAEQQAHLLRIDAQLQSVVDTFNSRITQDEIEAAKVAARVGTPMVRQPRQPN